MDYKRPNMRAQPEGMAFYKDINEFLLYVIKGKLHCYSSSVARWTTEVHDERFAGVNVSSNISPCIVSEAQVLVLLIVVPRYMHFNL